MRPHALPETEADLDEWSVYADWLMVRADPLGELLACELAMAATPGDDELREFHTRVARMYRPRRTSRVTWSLGHARSLEIFAERPLKMTRTAFQAPAGGTLANAQDFLRSERAALLESLDLPYVQGDRNWRRLLAAVPATCTRLRLGFAGTPEADQLRELAELIPASVRELAIAKIGPLALDASQLVLDRFAVVDVGRVRPEDVEPLAAALARTRTVELRVAAMLPSMSWERCRLGTPRDAAILQPDDRRATLLARWPAGALQHRYGPIPIRAQLAGALPEDHALGVNEGVVSSSPQGANLVRRGDAWTLRGRTNCTFSLAGVPVTAIVPVRDGDRLGIESRYGRDPARADCVFAARAGQTCAALLASFAAGA